MSKANPAIAENLRRVRKLRGLTQVEVAEKANISRSYYADVESSRYNPSFETLNNLADALGVSLSELIRKPDIALLYPNEADTLKEESAQYTTLAAHRTGGYDKPLTEDESIAVNAFLEAYRKGKQNKKD